MNLTQRIILIGTGFVGIVVISIFIAFVGRDSVSVPPRNVQPPVPLPQSVESAATAADSAPSSIPETPDPRVLPPGATVISANGASKNIIYSEDRTIWRADISSSIHLIKILDEKFPIRHLVLSPSKTWLAYTYRAKPLDFASLSGMALDCTDLSGDTLVLYNLKTKQRKIVFQTKKTNGMVRSVQFLKPHELFFIADTGKVYNTNSQRLFTRPEFTVSACLSYRFLDWTMDRRFALLQLGYYEGGGWSVYDNQRKVLSKTINTPSIEGGLDVLGFSDARHVLAFRTMWDEASPEIDPIPRLELYDTNFMRTAIIPLVVSSSYPWVGDWKLNPSTGQHIISIDIDTQEQLPVIVKTFLVDTNKKTATFVSSSVRYSYIREEVLSGGPAKGFSIVREGYGASSTLWRVEGTFDRKEKIASGDLGEVVAF